VRLGLLPLAVATFGLVAELGSENGLAANLVSLEGGAMFVMGTLTVAWIMWLAGEQAPRAPGMVGAPAPLQR
jgi:hypothetical protein